MSNVELEIAGRRYLVACEPGEESRVALLGNQIDRKLAAMGPLSGQTEARLLLFAALMLADEAQEAGAMRDELARTVDALGETLETLASRMENLATRLEEPPASA